MSSEGLGNVSYTVPANVLRARSVQTLPQHRGAGQRGEPGQLTGEESSSQKHPVAAEGGLVSGAAGPYLPCWPGGSGDRRSEPRGCQR